MSKLYLLMFCFRYCRTPLTVFSILSSARTYPFAAPYIPQILVGCQ
jgi:hypothetical protein